MIGKIKIVFCSLLFALNAAGQEAMPSDSAVVDSVKKKHTLMDRIHQVQAFLDKRAKSSVDPNFIEVPEKPWRVILRNKNHDVDVEYSDIFFDPTYNESTEWKLLFEPPMASSIGIWVGYRGTGISFSQSLNNNSGRYFSISSTGARYGFNFRLRRFNTSKARLTGTTYEHNFDNRESTVDTTGLVQSPVWIRSVYVNGYYVFNGRRYSQAAAYNQSVIQRRSAGSFLLGATWYQSSFDYSDVANGFFMMLGHGVHRIKVHQANIGFGYGYNFVPCRGLVINAMAMPTISVYNRVKAYKYDFNYDLSTEDDVDDYGSWNRETKTWENGKTHKSLLFIEDAEIDNVGEYLDYWDMPAETTYSMFNVNVDLRFGIAYNWKNWFIGAQGQFNNFSYKKDENRVRIVDTYLQVSLGVRL